MGQCGDASSILHVGITKKKRQCFEHTPRYMIIYMHGAMWRCIEHTSRRNKKKKGQCFEHTPRKGKIVRIHAWKHWNSASSILHAKDKKQWIQRKISRAMHRAYATWKQNISSSSKRKMKLYGAVHRAYSVEDNKNIIRTESEVRSNTTSMAY